MRFDGDLYHRSPSVQFRAILTNGIVFGWLLEVRSISDALYELRCERFSERCLNIWWSVRREPDRRAVARLAEWYAEALRYCQSYSEAEAIRSEYESLRAQLVRRDHDQRAPAFVGDYGGIDYGRGPDRTAYATVRIDRVIAGEPFYDVDPKATRARKRAESRGLKLLKQWLSPAQREQYQTQQFFEVTGCDTGARYRIRHGTQMNIEQLDEKGRKVCGWCFLPEGGLVAGDVMLAQKIALETNERAALKVANRIASMADRVYVTSNPRGPSGWLQGMWEAAGS